MESGDELMVQTIHGRMSFTLCVETQVLRLYITIPETMMVTGYLFRNRFVFS
jgi:hypothetical protein